MLLDQLLGDRPLVEQTAEQALAEEPHQPRPRVAFVARVADEVLDGLGAGAGELGIRPEGTVAVTADGCENLCSKWSGTPEDPAVV